MTTRQHRLARIAKQRAEADRRAQFKCEPKVCQQLKRLKAGVEIQTWGIASDNSLIFAGVHFVPEITARWLYRLLTNWQRWRKWYDSLPENRNRDYPAKHDPRVAFIGAHPIDAPKAIRWLKQPQTPA